MLTLDDLNSYFDRGYTIGTLNDLYQFGIDLACELKTKHSVFLYRPEKRFVKIIRFIDFPATRVCVEEYTTGKQFDCFITDLF